MPDTKAATTTGLLAAASIAVAAAAAGCGGGAPANEGLTVAAAASLRRVMPEIVDGFRTPGGPPVSVTYGASGDLRRQVEAGAPIDLVVLAAAEPVDALIRAGLADAASRRVVAVNRLVLVGPAGREPVRFDDLGRLPETARLAIGDPRTVPAGWYARQALVNLGVWEGIEGRLVYGGHVAGVLTYARRGEVDLAVVYATDAAGLSDVTVLDTASGPWAPTPLVVAALTRQAAPAAARLLDHLVSEAGKRAFERYGFGTAGAAADAAGTAGQATARAAKLNGRGEIDPAGRAPAPLGATAGPPGGHHAL